MTWFRVDDGWADHDKTILAGPGGRGLWLTSGVKCAQARVDGVVAAHRLPLYCSMAGVSRRASGLLVSSGLWHDADSIQECTRCLRIVGELPRGSHYFHDWTDYQPTREDSSSPSQQARWRRRKALLRDRDLCERICARDRDQCRYCGVRVNWRDRKGSQSGTYDHIDPDCFEPAGGNYLEAVVVACRRCNARKKDRTPEEAGMPLLDVPGPSPSTAAGPSPDLAGSDRRPDPDQAAPPPDQAEDPASRARDAGEGTGRVGPGDGQIPDTTIDPPPDDPDPGATP